MRISIANRAMFPNEEAARHWELHCIHTDGMRDAMSDTPSRAQQIADLKMRASYEQGYQDGKDMETHTWTQVGEHWIKVHNSHL